MMLTPDQARRLADSLMVPDADDPGPHAALDGRTFGNYRVARLVGIGGMGEVYEAQQDRTGRRVAIKVIRPELISADVSRRFEHEVRVLARLQHPGIAQVYEAGRVETPGGQTPYFAMEFVEGQPLTKWAADRKLSVREKLDLFLKVCDAVEHAHRKGVIHRDLKPGNILVDASGEPRVLDFGVARATDSDVAATTLHTDIGKVIGTLPYMSPEQVSGDPDALDTRSDVYSLGVVLYELLAGKPPYEIKRGQIHEAARVIREEDPTRLGLIDKGLRGDLETVVGRSLEKKKERRYQSVGELSADVHRFLATQPVLAKPPSRWYVLLLAAQRHRTASLLGALSIIALASTAAIATVAALKQHSARIVLEATLSREQERSHVATVVTEFLQRLLASPDPSRKGASIRVSDLLDEATRQLDNGQAPTPQVEGALREAIGLAYLGAGSLTKAGHNLSRAHEIAISEFGAEDYRTLTTDENLALLLQNQGKFDDAVELMRNNVEVRTRTQGRNDPATLHARYGLAVCLAQSGDKVSAAKSLEELSSDAATTLGPRDVLTLEIRSDLGSALEDLDRPQEAEKILRGVLDDERASIGSSRHETITTMNNLAVLLSKAKKFSEARALYAEALKASEDVYGQDSPPVIITAANLAQALFREGDIAAAELQMRNAVGRAEKALGPDHPTTLGIRFNLAKLFRSQNRYDEYEPMLRDIVNSAQNSLGPHSTELGMYSRAYGECMLKLKHYDSAEHYLTQAFAIYSESVGKENAATRGTATALIALYKETDSPEKAQKYEDFLKAVHKQMKDERPVPPDAPTSPHG